MANSSFRLRLPEPSATAMTIDRHPFARPGDGAHVARRTRLLAALAGLGNRPRNALGKAVGAVIRGLVKRGFTGRVELALSTLGADRVVQAVVAVSPPAAGDQPPLPAEDLDAVRAQLELAGSRLSHFAIADWSTPRPRVTLSQVLPADSWLPAPREAEFWSELLDRDSLEDAVVAAEERVRRLHSDLDYAQAHQQSPEAIAAANADRDHLETLSVVVSRASNVIVIMDAAGMIHWVNDAFTALCGYTQADVAGKRLDELLFGPSTSDDAVREFHQALQQGHELTQDLLQYHADGRTCWVESQLIPVHDDQGRLTRWIALLRDITRRRQTEEALRSAKQAAEESSQAKSEFLANMSHEIRTPLNAVLGMTELCLTTELSPEQQEYLRTVQSSADTLMQLLNDILDLSKIEAGKMELEETDFNLAEVVRDTLKALAVRAHEKQLELAVQMPLDLPQYVRGDPTRLRQVLYNLVGNAIKFTSRGEVAVVVEEQWSGEDEIGLHFAVRDTGIGIPAEQLEKIFQSFTQADSSMARRFGGSGLGLTITAQLLQLMQGRIWVRSKAGEGSTFHFTIRLKLAEQPPAEAAVDVSALQGKRALIVDDNATNRRILNEMLRKWGVTAMTADSAHEALRALEAASDRGQPIDIVLLDAMMPQVDGYQLAEVVQERNDLQIDAVLMVSSVDRPNSTARCRALGIGGYLLKPVTAASLLEALLAALEDDSPRPHAQTALPQRSAARPLAELPPPTKPLRILVADDHQPNRDLAVEILQRRGHECLPVADGDEALTAFEREELDLILMDVQMPSLDGLSATREIRRLETARGGRIPIIALTAHALAGDREKCLAAGMDDYLPKPLHARQLVTLVESRGEASSVPPGNGSAQPAALQRAAFDFTAALERMGGEQDLLHDHMNYVLNDAPALLGQLRQALSDEDARQLEIAAHRLKSLVSSYNHDEARDLAVELEERGKAADFTDTERALSRLTLLVSGLIEAIQNYLRHRESD